MIKRWRKITVCCQKHTAPAPNEKRRIERPKLKRQRKQETKKPRKVEKKEKTGERKKKCGKLIHSTTAKVNNEKYKFLHLKIRANYNNGYLFHRTSH